MASGICPVCQRMGPIITSPITRTREAAVAPGSASSVRQRGREVLQGESRIEFQRSNLNPINCLDILFSGDVDVEQRG